MNHRFKVAVISALGVLLLAGCGQPRYWETLDDPYTLAAMDSMTQMAVCRATPGGGCVEDINATVFAAGINRDYVVAARRAWSAFEGCCQTNAHFSPIGGPMALMGEFS